MSAAKGKAHSAVVLCLGVNGLGLVRALGRNEVNVYGFYHAYRKEMGRFSKYVVPYYFKDRNDLLQKLMEISNSEKERPVLFSSSDEFIDFIVENDHILKQHFLYNLPDVELLGKLSDKKEIVGLLDETDIPYPRTFSVEDIKDMTSIDDIANQLELPVIVKPVQTWDLDAVDNMKNLIFEEKAEFVEYLERKRSSLNKVVIQEIIPHNDSDVYYCTGYYNNRSELLCIFSAQKIRQYLPKYGITSFAVSKTVPDVMNLTESFLGSIKYTGLFDIEFVLDHRDMQYKFIEVNLRTHLANSHSEFCGVNMPYIAYCDLIDVSTGKIKQQDEDVYWIYFQMDKGSCYRKLKDGEINLMEWLRSLFLVRSHAIWAKDDMAPFWKSITC